MLSSRLSWLTFRSSQVRVATLSVRGLSDAGSSASATAKAISSEEKLALIRQGESPSTGESLEKIAASIWGWNTDPVGPQQRSGAKILARPLKGPLYSSWYPPRAEENKANEFRLTEKQERWRNKLRILRSAGKGPPKKGEGKGSKKKK